MALARIQTIQRIGLMKKLALKLDVVHPGSLT